MFADCKQNWFGEGAENNNMAIILVEALLKWTIFRWHNAYNRKAGSTPVALIP